MLNDRSKWHIRESALAGFRAASHVLLFAVLIFPFQVAINWIFGNDTWREWHLPFVLATAFASIWFVFTLVATFLDLRKQDRIGTVRCPTFSATAFVSGVYGIAAVGSLGLIAGLHGEGDPTWMQFLPLIFVALAFYAWPRTILCNETGVSQRNLWGHKKTIPYASVEAISVGYGGTTTVIGAGVTIEHTPSHVDPESFRHILSKRGGKPVY